MPRLAQFAVLALALLACRGAADEPTLPLVPEVEQIDDPPPDASLSLIEPTPFRVFTYDGSGELVHPDVVVFPKAWHAKRYWYAATPYPFGNPAFENPSGYVGNGRDDWHLAEGASNPLAMPARDAYLSDPDLVYDPVGDELRMYYRQTTRDADEIYVKSSADGVHWREPVLVVREGRYDDISPAVTREADGSWRMWTVGAGMGGCNSRAPHIALRERRSRDGINWGAASPVSLTIPYYVPWHWDVQRISAMHEYWALVTAYPDGADCSRSSVYFARSADGTTWTVSPRPLMTPGTLDELQDLVYRSTFRYFSNGDVVTVWYSGARREGRDFHYAVASARYPLDELLRRVGPAPGYAAPSRQAVPRPTYEDSVARAAFVAAFP